MERLVGIMLGRKTFTSTISTLLSSLLILCVSQGAWSTERAESEMPRAQFHFQHQTIAVGDQYKDESFWRDERNSAQHTSILKNSEVFGRVNQYDAKITYPFASHKNLNFDLGLNLRFLNGDLTQSDLGQTQYHLNTALPMFYANALYTLPNSGLSASFGASHFEDEQYYALDYKAKLSYQWQSGFGLEGGWQHQQFSIDGGDIQAEIENKGPFIDFKYNF